MKVLIILSSGPDLRKASEKSTFWIEEYAENYHVMDELSMPLNTTTSFIEQHPAVKKSELYDSASHETMRLYQDHDFKIKLAETMLLTTENPAVSKILFDAGKHTFWGKLPINEILGAILKKFYRHKKLPECKFYAPATFFYLQSPEGESLIKGNNIRVLQMQEKMLLN